MAKENPAEYAAIGRDLLDHLFQGIAPFVSDTAAHFNLTPSQIQDYARVNNVDLPSQAALTYKDLDLANILHLAETHPSEARPNAQNILRAYESSLTKKFPAFCGTIRELRTYRHWLSHRNRQPDQQVTRDHLLHIATTIMQWLSAIPAKHPEAQESLKKVTTIFYQLALPPIPDPTDPPETILDYLHYNPSLAASPHIRQAIFTGIDVELGIQPAQPANCPPSGPPPGQDPFEAPEQTHQPPPEPGSSADLNAQAAALVRHGDHSGQMALLNQILEQEPHNETALFVRSMPVMRPARLRNPQQELVDRELLASLHPHNPLYRGLLAAKYAEMGLVDQAITEYSHCIARQPDLAANYEQRGDCCLRIQRRDQALADYNHALALGKEKPKKSSLVVKRARCLAELNLHHAAIADYNQIHELHQERLAEATAGVRPQYRSFHYYAARALSYAAIERYPEAIADYTAAISDHPRPDYYQARGAAYEAWAYQSDEPEQKKRLDLALADYDQADRIQAENQIKDQDPDSWTSRLRQAAEKTIPHLRDNPSPPGDTT